MNIPIEFKKKLINDVIEVLIEELRLIQKTVIKDENYIDGIFYTVQEGVSNVTKLFLNEKDKEKRKKLFFDMAETFIKACGGYWSSILLTELDKIDISEIINSEEKQ